MAFIQSAQQEIASAQKDGSQAQQESRFSQARTLEIKKKIYSQIYEKSQKVLSEGLFQNTDVRILNLARITPYQNWVIRWIKMALALILLGWVAWRFKQPQRQAPETESLLSLKSLGNFPAFSEEKEIPSQEIHLLLDRNPNHPFCDEIKKITDQVLAEAQQKNIKSVLFTLVGPEAGKINIMSNLGVALAQRSKKVLLMDACWRQPLLNTIFSLENDLPGLVDVLLGKADLNAATQMVEIPNLYVLPTGPEVPSSFELLSSPSLNMLLKRIRPFYDFIFIESHELFEYRDIVTLAHAVDGVILVQDCGPKYKSVLTISKELSRSDIEGLSWLGKVNLNLKEWVCWH
ncbi:MAG: CpsD/CapB family tyrosine-protein kinase [Deltaproteobacteria bacterium]|nr:CpsD/CapB family tyrosine-protein kinase [Deltaproteobacteria bacterium]